MALFQSENRYDEIRRDTIHFYREIGDMRHALVLLAASTLLQFASFAAETPDGTAVAKKVTPEERRRRFEALKKELEAFRPAQDAERDEVLVYLQQVINASTKFAKENPKTPEGFEAASSGAMQLAARAHPKSSELAQIALDAAPSGGVDVRQVAICWLLVASGSMVKGDFAGARVMVEKIKTTAPDLYALAVKQIDEQEAKEKK